MVKSHFTKTKKLRHGTMRLLKSQNQKLTRTNPQSPGPQARAPPATSYWEGKEVLFGKGKAGLPALE